MVMEESGVVRLVLNGLTVELRRPRLGPGGLGSGGLGSGGLGSGGLGSGGLGTGGLGSGAQGPGDQPGPGAGSHDDDSDEYYHELELCRLPAVRLDDYHAAEVRSAAGDGRMAFAAHGLPSAPLWVSEVGGGGERVRPADLPALVRHCPNLSPSRFVSVPSCSESSPSSSEESCSPGEVASYRRLGSGLPSGLVSSTLVTSGLGALPSGMARGSSPAAPLMRRLALGLTRHHDDDDSMPLVADTPTTPTNLPVCLNSGYMNSDSRRPQHHNHSSPSPGTSDPSLDPSEDDIDSPGPPDVPALPVRDKDFNNCANTKPCVGGCSSSSSSVSANNNHPPHDSHHDLRHAPWYQLGLPREIALEVLSLRPPGSFLVRGSSQAGRLALSVRVPSHAHPAGIAHYLILTNNNKYSIKGFTKEFNSLQALVTHHSVMRELLPVPLLVPRSAPPPPRSDHADIDSLDHPHTHTTGTHPHTHTARAHTHPHPPPHTHAPHLHTHTLHSHTHSPAASPRRTPRHTPHHTYLTQLDV